MKITITVDENLQSQIVYSVEMSKYLEVYILNQVDIDFQKSTYQGKIVEAQAQLDRLTALDILKNQP